MTYSLWQASAKHVGNFETDRTFAVLMTLGSLVHYIFGSRSGHDVSRQDGPTLGGCGLDYHEQLHGMEQDSHPPKLPGREVLKIVDDMRCGVGQEVLWRMAPLETASNHACNIFRFHDLEYTRYILHTVFYRAVLGSSVTTTSDL
jgi:hypothetical protein